jgi:hypothetical protein
MISPPLPLSLGSDRQRRGEREKIMGKEKNPVLAREEKWTNVDKSPHKQIHPLVGTDAKWNSDRE